MGADELHESLDGEAVVLCGDAEAVPHGSIAGVALLDQARLLDDLASVAEELLAVGSGDHALARTVEDLNAEFVLKLAHGGGEARLGDE